MTKNSKRIICFAALVALLNTNHQISIAKPREMKMSGQLKRQLTIFFEDVCAAELPYFQNGKISNKALIAFGLYHNELRNERNFKVFHFKQGAYTRISAKHIGTSVARYFGKSVKHEPIPYWQYKNGYYTGDAAAFESLGAPDIEKLRLINKGDDLYTAYVDVKVGDFEENMELRKIKATLKKVVSNGRSRFIIVEYQKAK